MMTSVKTSHRIQNFSFSFFKVFKFFNMWANFKSSNSSSLSRKKYVGYRGWGNLTHIPYSRQWTEMRWMEYSSLNLLSHLIHWITSNFSNIAFYTLFYTNFYCLSLCETNSFILKLEPYFKFFCLAWGEIRCCSIKDPAFLVLFV